MMTPERLAELRDSVRFTIKACERGLSWGNYESAYHMMAINADELVAEVERLQAIMPYAKAAAIAFGSETEGAAIADLGKLLAEMGERR